MNRFSYGSAGSRPEGRRPQANLALMAGGSPVWAALLSYQPDRTSGLAGILSEKVITLATTFNPTAGWVIDRINKVISDCGKPKHLISDYGTQFTAGDFKEYIEKQGIYHRYAKISKANGNSKVERFFLSLKSELLNLFLFFSKTKVDRLLKEYLVYYNEHRPHEALDGQMPDEVYSKRPRDKPSKDDKVIKGQIEKIILGEGLLKAYRLKKVA